MSPEQRVAIAEFFEAVQQLEELKVIRSSRFLGDLGEFLCADSLGIALVHELRLPGHDGTHEGKRVQVKFNNSAAANNINVGNPEQYDELIVVLGPKSKLREPDHKSGEFRFYRFSSEAVKQWRGPSQGYYCAKLTIRNCANKSVL